MSSYDDIRKSLRQRYGSENTVSVDRKEDEDSYEDIRTILRDKYSDENVRTMRNSVSDWAKRYDEATRGWADFDSKRNNGFARDIGGGFNQEIESLIEEYESIKSYADRMGLPNAKRYVKELENLQSHIQDGNKYFSQWDTEADYLDWKREVEEYEALKSFDIQGGEKEIGNLEKILNEYKALSRTMIDENMEKRMEYIRNNYGDENGIKSLIADKKQYLNRAKHLQEGITMAGVINNDDFQANSGYVSTKTEGTWNKLTSDFGMGYEDLTYEYINGEENGLRQEIINKAVSYDADTDKFFAYDHMTEDQIATYNYYYAKDGKEAAEKYLDSIQETLNYQSASERFTKMEDKTFLEMMFGFEAGVDQFQSGMKNLFNTEDTYIPQSSTQMVSGMVREDLADNGAKLPDWLGGASIAQAGYDAITTTANMAPSMLTSVVLGAINPTLGAYAGNAMMGASAAGGAYQEALNNGYDKTQARVYSTLIGGSEAILGELLGGFTSMGGTSKAIAKALNGVDNGFLRFIGKLGGSMLSEGFEEGLQEVLNSLLSNMILHTDEDINWSEVAYSTLLGALTAGVMEGPTSAISAVKTYSTGKQLQDAGISAARLAELGQTFSADTVAYQLAGRVNENTGAYTMGRLFNEIGATLSEQNITEITEALVKEGIPRAMAKDKAKIMAKIVDGATLTDGFIEAMDDDKILARAVKTTIIDPNATWFQRSKGYNETLMALANEKTSRTNPAQQSQENAPTTDTVGTQNKEGAQSLSEAVDTSPAKVQTISKIENGQVTVKLEDGTEVNVKQADLSVDEGVRVDTIANLDGISAADANFILNTLRTNTNASAQMDSLGAREAYKYGFYGFSTEHMTTHGVFSNSLTEAQRKAIYETGRSARQRQVEVKQATVKAKTQLGKEKSTGKVHFEGDRSTLTERQSASLTAMEKVADALGVQIYVFESEVNERGQRVGANGWYDPKDNSIHIDLHAGAKGEGTMLFTAAHELTHFVRQWSPAKFKTLADFLMQEYGKKGLNVDALVREQMNKAKRNGRTISYDTAYEEVVADSMEMMLADGNVMEKLAKLKAQDKSLWQKIKDFINELAAKIRAVYDGMAPDSVEGRHVAEMVDAIERLQELFAEGLVDASENYQSAMETVVAADAKAVSEEEIITDGAVVTDGQGKKYSLRSMKQDIAEGQMFEDLKTYCGWTQKQVDELRNNLADLVEYMTPYRDILDMNETYGREGRRFSPYKPNSDPLYKISMDFSTLCSKRLLTQYVIENLQLRENRPMSAEEQMAIRDMLNEYRKVEKGLQVACAMCYVEAARLKSPKQITKWMEDPGTQMKNYFADKNPEFANFIKEKQADFKESRGYDRNATKKDMSPKDVRDLNKIRPRLRSQYQLSPEEAKIIERAESLPGSTYLTAGNLASLSETDPTIYAAYTAFVRTATRSKSLETDEPYYYGDSRRDNGNGIIVSDSFIEAVNRENGMRFSSWSDWRIQHLLDYITAVIDNSVRGAAMHGYTKFGDEVRVLGKTGMMFNMSGVAGTQTGLNEDGSLSFSPTESIDVNEAIQLREEFPDTAGLQCIGVGDDHIIALLRSDIIDYVIPYHVSGLNAGLRAMANIHGWKDYTSTQHAAIDKSIKFENAVDKEHWHEEPVYSEFFVGYDTGMTGIEAMRASADRYVQMCKDRGLKPKFEQFVNEDNYWKLLIDRKMVNQKTGKLIKQKPVTPTFDFDTVKSVVDQFVENYESGLENWDSIPKRIRDLKKQGSSKAKKASKAVDTLANQTLAAQPAEIKRSDRDSESVSNRSLLANAFESVAQNDIERQKIQEYKGNIARINAEERKLQKLNEQIKDLSFSKGPKDTKAIRDLQFEAKQTANRISTYDKQLLRLEASKPLQDVLTREKKLAYQRAEKKGKEALEAYREKTMKYQQELVDKWEESRKRGIESRQKADMRQKIRKAIRELDKILNHGDKKKNVKEEMKGLVSSAIQSAEVLFTDNYSNEDILRNGFGVQLGSEEKKHYAEAKKILDSISELGTGYEVLAKREELNKKLSYRMAQLREAFYRERNRLNETRVSEVLSSLADAYYGLQSSETTYIKDAYHASVHEYLKYLQDEVGGTTVRDMNMSQLESLNKAYTMVLETVRNANKMFNEKLKESRDQLANAVMREVKKAGGDHGDWSKLGIKFNQFSWNNMKPIYAAERIGSETFSRVVSGLFDGQYKWATNMEKAREFQLQTAKKYKVNNWDMEKTYKFTSSNELDFTLNLEQILALYAYSKREAAHDHITNGGIVFGKNTEVIENKHGIKVHKLKRSATTYSISDTLLGEIISKLDDSQKKYVDEMQKYLSETMGGLGNEVSMRLYGVKLFGEENYFPLRSAGQYMEKAREADLQKQQGHTSLVNSGFTHAVKPHAKNPIVLDGFMDVWAGHVNEMAMYNGMVLPMEDFRKVYNYHTPFGDGSTSVNGVIENAYGAEATGYFDQLYQELNSGAVSDPRETDMLKWVGKFKKAAVMASMSVVMQQPSAIGRAFALIDPKYFVGQRISESDAKKQWDEVKKYAPVAIIKEMGGFDTHTGAGAKDFLLAKEYSKDEIAKALKDKDYLKERANVIMGYLPSKADEITWVAIWQAVKREVRASNPNLHGEEFLKKAGSRFSEVIEKTQVYDSVLAKSANMRAKTGLMTMATSFMAEPTTTINMIENAFQNKKNVGRVLASAVTSIILNNLLASAIYAMRDDDEGETFWEKYAEAVASGIVDDLNPITYYPFLKDVWSIFQGYDVERSDMSIISDVSDALKKALQLIGKDTSNMDEDELAEYHKTVWSAILSLADGAFSALGVPFKNARREVESWFNTSHTLKNGLSYNRTSLLHTIADASLDALPVASYMWKTEKSDRLYDAILSGNTAYVDRLRSEYDDEKQINNVIRKGLRENDSRIYEAALAQINGHPEERVKLQRQVIADGFILDDVVIATNTIINNLSPSAGTSEPKKKGLYSAEDFALFVANGKASLADEAKKDIIATHQLNGKTADEAEKSFQSSAKTDLKEMFLAGTVTVAAAEHALKTYCGIDAGEAKTKVNEWTVEKKYGFAYDDKKEAYLSGKISYSEMKSILMNVGGKDESIAEEDIAEWEYEAEHPDLATRITYTKYKRWQEEGEPYGVSVDMFTDVAEFRDDGTSESVKSQEEVAAYINSLPISSSQKDALWCCFWKESTLKKAPWR